jgi:hypothetical protein
MIYLKNLETGEIIKGESFGSFFDSWIKLTQDEIDAYELGQLKAQKISQCKNYLNATDKYFIEAQDTNTNSYPQKVSRQQAREAIPLLKSCTTLEELNAININFE